eukprot:scaffold7589_cov106-Isochrysis_galbana.AAC.1
MGGQGRRSGTRLRPTDRSRTCRTWDLFWAVGGGKKGRGGSSSSGGGAQCASNASSQQTAQRQRGRHHRRSIGAPTPTRNDSEQNPGECSV